MRPGRARLRIRLYLLLLLPVDFFSPPWLLRLLEALAALRDDWLFPDDAEFEATFPKLTQTTNLELARAIEGQRVPPLVGTIAYATAGQEADADKPERQQGLSGL